MEQRTPFYSTGTIIGGAALIAGAALLDVGRLTGRPPLESLGNLPSALASLPLLCLPLGLRSARVVPATTLGWIGTVCWTVGTAIVSLVDVPAISDPANTAAGIALGPPGLLLLSLGFLAWFGAIQRQRSYHERAKWLFLIAGLWFFLSFPTVQLPLFVLPSGSPLFLLLSGFYGLLQLLIGVALYRRATHARSSSATI